MPRIGALPTAQQSPRVFAVRINRAYSLAQFWDGRAPTKSMAKGPIANPIEMGNTHQAMEVKLSGIQGYRPMFQKAFGSPDITADKGGDRHGPAGAGRWPLRSN